MQIYIYSYIYLCIRDCFIQRKQKPANENVWSKEREREREKVHSAHVRDSYYFYHATVQTMNLD